MIQVTINNKFQKREGTYKEILNNGVLDDLVKKLQDILTMMLNI